MTVTVAPLTAQAAQAASLIAGAFSSLEVASWLVPNPEARQRVLAAQFAIIVDHAFRFGAVEVAVGEDGHRDGIAVWLHQTGSDPLPPPPQYEQRLARLAGVYLERLQTLDAAFDTVRPQDPHHHLAFLAVRSERQGAGVGSALLESGHAHADAAGLPVVLEAACPRSRALYERHGYRPTEPLHVGGTGPVMWPMRRPAVKRANRRLNR